MRKPGLILWPFVWSLFILGTLSLSIHYYRTSFSPGTDVSPQNPRSQRPFDLHVPLKSLDTVQPGTVLRLRVRKIRNAFFSTAYYASGSAILNLPVQVTGCGICVRLSLWDAGKYRITLEDRQTGKILRQLPLTVIVPLSLYRNDGLLLFAIILLSFLSGKLAEPAVRALLPELIGRTALHRQIVAAFIFLSLGLLVLPYPRTSSPHQYASPTSFPQESEGRTDARPAPLIPPGGAGGGILKIGHNMDSWTDYGRSLTLFEGPVGDLALSGASILLPDDGRYFVTLWTPALPAQTRQTSWVIRANPVSPPFPWSVYSGMVLLSMAGFLAGATFNGRRDPDSRSCPRESPV